MLHRFTKNESSFNRWVRPALSSVFAIALLAYVLYPSSPKVETVPILKTTTFLADFDAKKLEACQPEGTLVDGWRFAFAGYGCNAISTFEDRRWLHVVPKAATKPGESHSALMVGPVHGASLTLTCDVVTLRQLRSGDKAKPWETGWLLWGFHDLKHFYYLALKTNGWEMGKMDPDSPTRQRYLATGAEVKTGMQEAHQIRIVQEGPTITLAIDGRVLTKVTDTERPYMQGRIAVYAQDADALFGGITAERFSSK